MNNNQNLERIFYLDVLRVIACFAVIMIHSSAYYVVKDFHSLNFIVGNIFDSISRIGVPLFVMISGALLLDEGYVCTKEKIIKHIKKMIIFYLFWSFSYAFFYQIILQFIYHNPIDIKKFCSSFILGHYHLWFCFMIVGIYIVIPLLRLWVKKENKKYVEYFLLLSIIFNFIIPQIIKIGGYYSQIFLYMQKIMENFDIHYFMGYLSYFILGWYIHNFEFGKTGIVYILGEVGFLITFCGTFILSNTLHSAVQLYANLSLNVSMQATMVFVLIKKTYEERACYTVENKKTKIISFFSKNSLGIYAIHLFFVDIAIKLFNLKTFNVAFIIIPIIFIFAFSFSLLFSWVLSKIPGLRKIV